MFFTKLNPTRQSGAGGGEGCAKCNQPLAFAPVLLQELNSSRSVIHSTNKPTVYQALLTQSTAPDLRGWQCGDSGTTTSCWISCASCQTVRPVLLVCAVLFAAMGNLLVSESTVHLPPPCSDSLLSRGHRDVPGGV